MYALLNEWGNYAKNHFDDLMIFADDIDANLWARENGYSSYTPVMVDFVPFDNNRNN